MRDVSGPCARRAAALGSRLRAVVAAALAAAVVASCGSSGPSSPAVGSVATRSPDRSVSPASTSEASSGASASRPSETAPISSPSPVASGPTRPDPGLFAIIGRAGTNGLTFQYDPDTTARVATDPGLERDASALAIGLYTVTGQTPVADYAIVSIVRLRDAQPDDAWFRAYRDSYDTSACAQAGGVARHAQTLISQRTVFIAGCTGGAFTYHVFLPAHGAVVSITAVGSGRLGERVAGAIEN